MCSAAELCCSKASHDATAGEVPCVTSSETAAPALSLAMGICCKYTYNIFNEVIEAMPSVRLQISISYHAN